MNQQVIDFFTSALAGGVIYDMAKYGMEITKPFLKDKIKKIVLTDNEIEVLAQEVNKLKGNEKAKESYENYCKEISKNEAIQELYERYGVENSGVIQNVTGNNNEVIGRDKIQTNNGVVNNSGTVTININNQETPIKKL